MGNSEGRHLSGMDAADKMDAARRAYSKSPKRRAAQRRYEESEKGRVTRDNYMESEKAALSRQKWRVSEKGQKTLQSIKQRDKTLRQADRWLKDHPDKTFKDFLQSLKS